MQVTKLNRNRFVLLTYCLSIVTAFASVTPKVMANVSEQPLRGGTASIGCTHFFDTVIYPTRVPNTIKSRSTLQTADGGELIYVNLYMIFDQRLFIDNRILRPNRYYTRLVNFDGYSSEATFRGTAWGVTPNSLVFYWIPKFSTECNTEVIYPD
jgi:hypothetical protein